MCGLLLRCFENVSMFHLYSTIFFSLAKQIIKAIFVHCVFPCIKVSARRNIMALIPKSLLIPALHPKQQQGFTFESEKLLTQIWQINLGERFVSCFFTLWWCHHFPFGFCRCRHESLIGACWRRLLYKQINVYFSKPHTLQLVKRF